MIIQNPTLFNLSPFGKGSVKEIIYRGKLYSVYRADLSGREICIKAPSPILNPGALFGSHFYGIDTSLYHGGNICVEKLEYGSELTEWLSRILLLEGELIRATQGAWNHSIIGFGTWDGYSGCHDSVSDDTFWAPNRYMPVMVMPYYSATPLSSLPVSEQRMLFPSLLPALWKALCVMHHGDLSTGNILFNQKEYIFHLIDPGVILSSTASGNMYSNKSTIFTTNAANYPLLPPFVDSARLGPAPSQILPSDLMQIIDQLVFRGIHDLSSRSFSWNNSSLRAVPTTVPHCSDRLALGILYFRLLTGEELFLRHGVLDNPVWQGVFGQVDGDSPASIKFQYQKMASLLTNGYIDAQIDRYPMTRGEKNLVRALLHLQITNENDLRGLVSSVRR